MGLLFGYYVIAPLAINFLGNYQVSDQISNIIDVSSFMTTVISVSFAAAVAFQLPLLIRLLATMGIVSSTGMRQYRKIAVVALLCFAAVITPPDVVSQTLIFFPCYALYEYAIGHVVPGWTSLLVSLWFIGGAILTAIGVIGEYIGKIYREVKRRPRYFVEKMANIE
jgi:hypothetical protein